MCAKFCKTSESSLKVRKSPETLRKVLIPKVVQGRQQVVISPSEPLSNSPIRNFLATFVPRTLWFSHRGTLFYGSRVSLSKF